MSKRFLRNRDQKIIDIEHAFTELINSTGYDKVTLRQIAGKAGVSVGIIYRYYPKGKPSIAASIFEKNFRETLIPYSFEEDSDKLENMFYNHLVGHRDNLELYRAFDLAMLADNGQYLVSKNVNDASRAIPSVPTLMLMTEPSNAEPSHI